MAKLKNILAIIFLILFFGIPLWLIGNAHEVSLQKTAAMVSAIQEINPVSISVASHTCHHLLPNALHKVMNPLMCWSCGVVARKIHQDFIVLNPSDRCPGRGQVTLLFTRKPS